jgi:hypothetical protein
MSRVGDDKMTTATATAEYLKGKISTAELLDCAAENAAAERFICKGCGKIAKYEDTPMTSAEMNGESVPSYCDACQGENERIDQEARDSRADTEKQEWRDLMRY